MADELLDLADRPTYYRALAALLRAQVHLLQLAESRLEISRLAAHYEQLAAFLDPYQVPSEPAKE